MTNKNPSNAVPDLSSVSAIRAAFEQLRPATKPAGRDIRVRPSPEEREQKEAYARFVRAAVPTVLGAERADAPRAFASWSPEQRALLEEIAKVPYEANINAGTLSGMLAKVGAINLGPGEDDRFLRRYVGLAEPGVLESEVQGRPLWLWLRLCLMGKLDREALLGSVAGLDDRARVELAKRAAGNAYQLTRRWPLPGDITPAIEDEDATQLFELLLPVLEPISANERELAISREQAAKVKNPGLVLLLSFGQARHGETVTGNDETLTSALRLSTALGMRFLTALPAHRRLELIEAIQLAPNNLDGWPYLDLLERGDKQRVVLRTLARFDRPAKPNVGARISELIRTFDSAALAELRTLAEKGGPNAKLIEAAPCIIGDHAQKAKRSERR